MYFDEAQKENGFLDPWGRGYHIRTGTNSIRIWSDGRNQRNENGAGDDILEERDIP